MQRLPPLLSTGLARAVDYLGKLVRTDDEAYARTPIDGWTCIAVLYIALPNLAFIFGWLRIPVSAPLACGLSIAVWQLLRRTSLTWRIDAMFFCLLALSIVWCLFGGAGHFMYANPDWFVRDAVYGDLIQGSWPPAYQVGAEQALLLRSAFGYFLPPALISKWLGLGAADITLYLWTVLGVAIFLNLLPLERQRIVKSTLLALIVVMFSGMDVIGYFIVSGGEWPIFPVRIAWWTSFSYTSISGQLFWAPNHSLPMWLGAALFYRHWSHRDFLPLAIVFAPLTLIWTPFAIVGLLPFFLLYLLVHFKAPRPNWPTAAQLLSGLVLGIIVTRFLTLSIDGIASKTGIEHAGGEANFWHAYLLFCITEFAALCLLLGARLKHSRAILVASALVLAALPFLFFGPSNDLLLRVSSPALMLLAILSMRIIGDGCSGGLRSFPLLLGIVLLIGACTPINEISRAWLWRHWRPDYRKTLLDVEKGQLPPHYVGRMNRADYSWLIKEPHTIPGAPDR